MSCEYPGKSIQVEGQPVQGKAAEVLWQKSSGQSMQGLFDDCLNFGFYSE